MATVGLWVRTRALERKAGLDFSYPFAIRGKPNETVEEVRTRYLAENGSKSLDGLNLMIVTRSIVN